MLALLVFLLLLVWLIIVGQDLKSQKLKHLPRKVAVLGRYSRGKLLRDLAAKARTEYPGQSEEWYWCKAQQDLKRYRN